MGVGGRGFYVCAVFQLNEYIGDFFIPWQVHGDLFHFVAFMERAGSFGLVVPIPGHDQPFVDGLLPLACKHIAALGSVEAHADIHADGAEKDADGNNGGIGTEAQPGPGAAVGQVPVDKLFGQKGGQFIRQAPHPAGFVKKRCAVYLEGCLRKMKFLHNEGPFRVFSFALYYKKKWAECQFFVMFCPKIDGKTVDKKGTFRYDKIDEI